MKNSKELIIPEGVNEMTIDCVFSKTFQLEKKITNPKTVKIIPKEAFENC